MHERCFFHEWNVFAMQKTDFHVVRGFFAEQVMLAASMHRITSLELLSTLMLCLVQVSNCKATNAEKLLSQERKLLNAILRVKLKYMKYVFFLMKLNVICNAEANARPQMLKRFLSQWEKVA